MKFKISREDIEEMSELRIVEFSFPMYTTQLINMISSTAQATRPSTVGQMSDLVPQYIKFETDANNKPTLSRWRKWYLKQNPEAIDRATDKILHKTKSYLEAIQKIDRPMIKKWVEDLVIYKSYKSLIYEDIALGEVAKRLNTDYQRARPEDESKQIDGFIEGRPVQVKKKDGKYNVMMDMIPNSHTLITYKENRNSSLMIEFDESNFI